MNNLIIENLPLFWRVKNSNSDLNIVPNVSNFEFEFDEGLQLLKQKQNNDLLSSLDQIYKADYNIGYLQTKNDISKNYQSDYSSYIQKMLFKYKRNIQSVLEIGCGESNLLNYFNKLGIRVIGIDPSPRSKSTEYEIINDFFPSILFQDKVDLIFHSDVLEHVTDPISFLNSQKDQLNDDGLLILAVPSCEENINFGDVSMVIHQHLSYFDKESLTRLLTLVGFSILDIRYSSYGGSLYCCAIKSREKDRLIQSIPNTDKYQKFTNKALNNINYISSLFQEYSESNSIGFYVPLRSFPYLSKSSLLTDKTKVRFFDDTSHWHNEQFDGIDISIENQLDLLSNPVDILFIMSLTFGDIIYNKVSSISKIKKIITLRDLLNV